MPQTGKACNNALFEILWSPLPAHIKSQHQTGSAFDTVELEQNTSSSNLNWIPIFLSLFGLASWCEQSNGQWFFSRAGQLGVVFLDWLDFSRIF